MKKRLFACIMALCFIPALAAPALADSFSGAEGWLVTFTGDTVLEANFTGADISDAVTDMQPGDDITFHMTLGNEYKDPVNYYMLNEVLYSLEDRSANSATGGGAYTYELVYTGPDGEENVLFSSDTVGGEDIGAAGEGLHEATNAMDEFFYLDTMTTGQTGTIRLSVALDGETQGNDYQNTLADLQMTFAVDIETVNSPFDPEDPEDPYNPENPDSPYNPTNPDSPYNPENPDSPFHPEPTDPPEYITTTDVVQTGDTFRALPRYIAMAVSGALFLLLGVYSVRQRRKEREEARHETL